MVIPPLMTGKWRPIPYHMEIIGVSTLAQVIKMEKSLKPSPRFPFPQFENQMPAKEVIFAGERQLPGRW